MKYLNEILSGASTEEEVKFLFAKFFKLKPDTKNFIDLYTQQILFEFKYDAPIKNIQVRAKIIAQTLYYVRRLKFGTDYRPVSKNICIVTKTAAAFFPTETFATFYDDKNSYDWDLAPSSPCKKLIAALAEFKPIIDAHIYDFSDISTEISFAALINNTLANKACPVKKITAKNFEQVFNYWKKLFGKTVANGRKPSEYFITDIEQGKSEDLRNSVLFRMTGGELVEKAIKPEKYHEFWDFYEKIQTVADIIAIRQKMDRMTEENLRRRTGEFYTPIAFADKAFDYLTRTVGKWWLDDNFRLWDMAAGTGNLEYNFAPEVLKHCYISTLIDDDANYCRKIFPDATVFQYDYLNDDEHKLPANLRDDLHNPNIKWIIFINPPYATASNFERSENRKDKDGVSMTKIRELMTADDMGAASRELYVQFIYRISKEFSDRQAWLGIFSTLKYINSNNDQPFRDKVFSYQFENGFTFNSKNFHGCKGQWPVGFLIWNLGKKIPLEAQEISLDVYNAAVEKIAEKIYRPARSENFLNKWVNRPRNVKKFPPMSSALNVGSKNKDIRDRVPEGFLASLMCWNEFYHQNQTAFLSGPLISAGGMSVTPENFEQYIVMHAVHLIPKLTWLNNRDQFMQPTKPLPPEFISDAVIWSLFAPSNQTVSLRNVEYEGEVYRMPNNFYPFELAEVQRWKCSSPEIRLQLARAHDDRFAALWIKNHELSIEAQSVLNEGRELYRKFYAELERLDVGRWKIEDWDAGWYQVRMSLGATINLTELSRKLEPQIYELGFLRDEVKYF